MSVRPFASILASAALALSAAAPPAAAGSSPLVPRFVDETAASGVTSVYAGDWEYMVGGGAAAFDCDDDRKPDLFLAGGSGASTLWRNASATGGSLRFEAAAGSGLDIEGVTGGYPLDVDGDGRMDLVLLRVGENLVMRGLGGCRFARANEDWGFVGGDAWSTALAATWERGASWPTIAIGNYIDRTKGAMPWGSCTDNWLHRPRPAGDGGGFAAPVSLAPSYCALSMLFTDWNRSGTPSLRVSNDREYYKGGQEQMWRVEPGRPPALYGEADGWKQLRIWGMGIASRDLDGDRLPEYFLTSMSDNKLQTLAEPGADPLRPVYKDVAFAKGATAHRPYTGGDIRPSTAWHAEFQDVNNDTLPDLFVAKGNVAEMPDFAARDPNNLLLQTAEGGFAEAGEQAGVASFGIARGATLADFNLDGLVDLVVVNRWTRAEVYRNTTAGAGHWLQLQLADPGPNRNAVGAWIEIRCDERVARQEVTVGGGHAGGQAGWLHVGLGDAAAAEIRVTWPDGEVGPWQPVDADGFYRVERGGEPVRWTP